MPVPGNVKLILALYHNTLGATLASLSARVCWSGPEAVYFGRDATRPKLNSGRPL